MLINGLVKTSLVDYPGHVATTIFTSGCNMRCPFCHNKDLVMKSKKLEVYSEAEVFEFLRKRRPMIEAVCITGGEPTLQDDLIAFIKKIKLLDFNIKLDTNGMNPNIIEQLLGNGLIDYIAMDIKNGPSKYSVTTGVPNINLFQIQKSINIIKSSHINYEFRTTVVKEFHNHQDFEEIGVWLSGSSKYVLQPYKRSDNQIKKILFDTYAYEDFLQFKQTLLSSINLVELRGF